MATTPEDPAISEAAPAVPSEVRPGQPAASHEAQARPEPFGDEERRCRLILGAIKDHAIFLLDPGGRVATWPAGAQQVFGYAGAEAIGQPDAFLYTAEERASGVPDGQLARARAEGSLVEERWFMRKNGEHFWSHGTFCALVSDDGSLHGFVKVVRDHTAHKLNAEALHRAIAEAQTAIAAKDDFLTAISHDLRTPLMPILLWAQILDREEVPDRALLRQGLEMIRKCAEEQHALIENLIARARSMRGKSPQGS